MCHVRWQSHTGNSLQEEDAAQPLALSHALQVVAGDAVKEVARHIHRKVGQLLPELKEAEEGFCNILLANTADDLCQSCMHTANSYCLH